MDLYQSLVTVNPVTLIAQICNLFIQLLVVKIFFLDKIKAILDQRREAADKQITDAEAAKAEAMAIKATSHFQKVGHYLGSNRLDHRYPKLLGRVTWNHEGEIYTWQSRRYRTSTPVGLKGRALNQRRFSRLNISWSLPC